MVAAGRGLPSILMLIVLQAGCSHGLYVSRQVATAQAVPGFDRTAASVRIEARLGAYRRYTERYRKLYERSETGEDVKAEIGALQRPGFDDLVTDAVRVLEADPSDEAAFRAIEVMLRVKRPRPENIDQWSETSAAEIHTRMAQLLLEHHLNRSGFKDTARFVYLGGLQSQAGFWERVYAGSANHETRGLAAVNSMRINADLSNEPYLSRQRRQALRESARQQATLIASSYANVEGVKQQADSIMQALYSSVDTVLPDLEAVDLGGEKDALGNYRGRVVLLDFWATWCGWCTSAHPGMVQLKREMTGRPFEIIAISVDDEVGVVRDYSRKQAMPWINWHVGPKAEVLEEWSVRGFPTYLLVNTNGVVAMRTHRLDSTAKQLIRALVVSAEGDQQLIRP